MKLSVIILNYNVEHFLHQCIVSVERALKGLDAEVIVIDNNSKDGSCALVKKYFPHIHLIENKENVGFSKANNQAVKAARGEYVCILNPDTAVAEDTFIEAFQYTENIDNLGALGIYLMDGTGNYLPESKRNLPTPKRSLLKLLGRTKGKNGYYATNIVEAGKGPVDVLVGAFMLLKRSVYDEVGGFDEDYFMYGEDIDLSYKLEKAGYKNQYLGSLSMLHYKGESTQKNSAYLKRFYGAMRIFYRKHFKSNVLLNIMVEVGVVMAKIFRKIKEKKRKKVEPQTTEIWVVTENLSILKRVSEVSSKPVKAVSKLKLEEIGIANTTVIFDVEYISYRQLFSVMKSLKNKGNRFRIKPPGCNFVIGSDQSDDKGGVLKLGL